MHDATAYHLPESLSYCHHGVNKLLFSYSRFRRAMQMRVRRVISLLSTCLGWATQMPIQHGLYTTERTYKPYTSTSAKSITVLVHDTSLVLSTALTYYITTFFLRANTVDADARNSTETIRRHLIPVKPHSFSIFHGLSFCLYDIIFCDTQGLGGVPDLFFTIWRMR